MDCSTPGFPVHHQHRELTQTHVHWVSDASQPSRPLSFFLCPSPPAFFPSIRVFSKESVLYIRWPKYWSFSFSISPSKEYSGLIFRIDWLDLLTVQGTLKSLLLTPQFKSIYSLAVGGRPQFLSTWASPQDCLSGIMAWWLASSVRETKVKSCNAFRQALEFVHHHFHHVLSFPLTSCD